MAGIALWYVVMSIWRTSTAGPYNIISPQYTYLSYAIAWTNDNMFRYTTGKQTAFTVDELCIFNVVVVTYKESDYSNKKRSAHFPKLGFNFHSLPQLALIEMKIGIYCVKHCMAGVGGNQTKWHPHKRRSRSVRWAMTSTLSSWFNSIKSAWCDLFCG